MNSNPHRSANGDHEARYMRYFAGHVATIELPPGDPSSLTTRVAARRRRRRVAASGVAAIALVAAAISVQQIGDDDGGAHVAAEGDAVVAAAPLQWTSVTPASGLVYAQSTATTEDGTQFGLSTAPGKYDPNEYNPRQTLYRSADGVEWSPVAVPDSLWPSQIAASGNDLYAVGTSPAAGGNSAVVVARSDGGQEWTTATLPLDLSAIEAEAGTEVVVQSLDVSSGPAGIVTAFQLQARAMPEDFIPAGVTGAAYAGWSTTGLDVYGPPEGCVLVNEHEIDCSGVTADGRITKPTQKENVIASFTFEELGIGDPLRSLILGELHVYVSADGRSYEEAALPAAARGGATLVSSDDGYVLFTTTWDEAGALVTAFRSADARTWTADDALTTRGYVVASGTLGGRAAVLLGPDRAGGVLRVQQADGSWATLDLADAVAEHGVATETLYVTTGDIGPLGAAAVVVAYDESTETQQQFIVHSPDGQSVSVQSIADIAGAPQGYAGSVRVSADAVMVVFGDNRFDDGVITSTLLVGTPN